MPRGRQRGRRLSWWRGRWLSDFAHRGRGARLRGARARAHPPGSGDADAYDAGVCAAAPAISCPRSAAAGAVRDALPICTGSRLMAGAGEPETISTHGWPTASSAPAMRDTQQRAAAAGLACGRLAGTQPNAVWSKGPNAEVVDPNFLQSFWIYFRRCLCTCERQYRIISEFYIYHTQFVRRLPAEEEREMLRFAQRGQRAARAVMRMGHATRQRQVCRRGLLARWCASRSDARRASRTAARARLTGPHAGRRMGAGGRQPGRKRRPNARPDAGALARRVGPARVCCAGAWRPRNRVADH